MGLTDFHAPAVTSYDFQAPVVTPSDVQAPGRSDPERLQSVVLDAYARDRGLTATAPVRVRTADGTTMEVENLERALSWALRGGVMLPPATTPPDSAANSWLQPPE